MVGHPGKSFLAQISNLNLFLVGERILELRHVNSVLQLDAVVLEFILLCEFGLNGIILSLELIGIGEHFLDFLW